MYGTPGADEVHLWRASLDVSPELADRFERTLSPHERARAVRFRRPTDRTRFVTAHGWLRQLLAGYLDTEPGAIVFVTDTHGKPRLADPSAHWLRFNLAHSAGLGVFAIAREREVGVDAEEVRDDVEIDGISRRMFSAQDCRLLAALPRSTRPAAFFATWTRNEAYVKAIGTGLGGADRGVGPPPGWTVAAFDAGPGYSAAVAVQGEAISIPPSAANLSFSTESNT